MNGIKAYRDTVLNRLILLQDGRDVPDGTSVQFVEQLGNYLAELEKSGCDAKIASGGGRMGVTMDRYEVDLHNLIRILFLLFNCF